MNSHRILLALLCASASTLAACSGGAGYGGSSAGPGSVAFMPAAQQAGSAATVIPKKIVLAPLSTLTRVTNSFVEMYGQGAHPTRVAAEDANGNPISSGASGPHYTITQIAGKLGLTIAQPSTQHPNQFAVTPPQSFSTAGAVLHVVATYSGATNPCKLAGAVCAANFNVKAQEIVAAATLSSKSIAILGADSTTPLVTIPTGANARNHSLAFDKSGDLFIAHCGTACQSNSVLMYAPPYNKASVIGPITGNVPIALAVDNAGNLFVASYDSGTSSGFVSQYAPPYNGAPNATIVDGVHNPTAMTTDVSGNLYVASTSNGGDQVAEYDAPITNAMPATHAVSSGISFPDAIAVNESGTIMVSNCQKCQQGIGGQSVTIYAGFALGGTITNGVSEPADLGVDSHENMFVFNGDGTVAKYTSLSDGASPAQTVSFGSGLLAGVLDGNATIFADIYATSTASLGILASPYTGTVRYLNYANSLPASLAVLP